MNLFRYCMQREKIENRYVRFLFFLSCYGLLAGFLIFSWYIFFGFLFENPEEYFGNAILYNIAEMLYKGRYVLVPFLMVFTFFFLFMVLTCFMADFTVAVHGISFAEADKQILEYEIKQRKGDLHLNKVLPEEKKEEWQEHVIKEKGYIDQSNVMVFLSLVAYIILFTIGLSLIFFMASGLK